MASSAAVIDIRRRNPLLPMTGPPDFEFMRLDKRLRGLETKIVYVGVPDPDYNNQRRWWDLAGSQGGKQGLDLAPHATGFMHIPFNSLFSEGPYQIGATYERTDYKKRVFNIGVMVGNSYAPDTSFRYRMLEQRWWASWSETEDGWLGVYTRTHGWRWIRVRLAEDPKTAFELDPVAFENNFMQWDMQIVATQPHWSKRMETSVWQNTAASAIQIPSLLDDLYAMLTGIPVVGVPLAQLLSTVAQIVAGVLTIADEFVHNAVMPIVNTLAGFLGFQVPSWLHPASHPAVGALAYALLQPGQHLGEGHIHIPNRSNVAVWPKYLVSTPGYAWIQDGIDGPWVQLPLTSDQDGPVVLVDTDPNARTLTGAADPVDNQFYGILRNSQIIDFLVGDLLSTTQPLWQRLNGRAFQHQIPPKTLATIKVRHTDADGTVTALMPQKFKMAYA